ncbi:uncharacterized protein LOC126979322 [Leptidea sinapis]|uniref:uncharacterized protein LOC126979322 n=1 Tax=Leptidea sinapis TaxID=189913 RepID=UPI00212C3B93|nr:uncharacterized protein LOC126979322 [Leptidea sinapis]
MDYYTLVILANLLSICFAWSLPFYNVRRPVRVTRFAPMPQRLQLIPVRHEPWHRPKRGHIHHDYDYDRGHNSDRDSDQDHNHKDTSGVTGPVHTYVKTDKNANYKWGVRHHVGKKFAS